MNLPAQETAPQHQIEAQTLEKINALFAHCRQHSTLYNQRLPKEPLHSLEEMQQVPIMSQQTFRASLPPEGEGGLTGKLEATYAFTSGGTTGKPKFVYSSAEDMDREASAIARGFCANGVKPGMVAANLMNAGHMWASFIAINIALEKCRCHILPIAAQTGEAESLALMQTFHAQLAIGIPSFMISLAQHAHEQHIEDVNIKLIATGGEHFFDSAKTFVQSRLGVERFISAGYSSNDTGPIAFQCQHCTGATHHVFQDLCYLEILDENTNTPSQTGKIIVTKLHNRLMPTIRYDIGDRGRLINDTCPCGRTYQRIELLGRSDDILCIGGYNVHPGHIAAAIEKTNGASPHFRMTARMEGPLDQLFIECETTSITSPEETRRIEHDLLANLIQCIPAFSFLLQTKGIAPPAFHIMPPGSLPRNPRTGKIKLVTDQRIPT